MKTIKTLWALLAFLATSQTISAQQTQRIKGYVVDHFNNPVCGVLLRAIKTGDECYSDSLGQFWLHLQENDRIGFYTKENGWSFTETKSSLKDTTIVIGNNPMDEGSVTVVSNGIALVNKRTSTGSYTTIDNRLFNKQVGTDVLGRLASITNGVQKVGTTVPGSGNGLGFNIRGLNTMTMAISKPLVILDNFEYTGNLENINPNDVEDITFLKDAAAASLWGARAANGVIVIRTKKTRQGNPMKISWNSNMTWIPVPNLYALPQMSSSDFVDVETMLYEKGVFNAAFRNPAARPSLPVATLLYNVSQKKMDKEDADRQISLYRNHDIREDYLSNFYHTGSNRQYALSMENGNDRTTWRLSAGLDNNNSNLYATFKRYNLLWSGRTKILPGLEMENAIYYTKTQNGSGRPEYGSITTKLGSLPPYTMFRDEQGNPLALYNQYGKALLDTVGQGLLKDWRFYPAEDYKYNNNTTEVSDFSSVWGIEYALSKEVFLSVKYRYGRQESNTKNLYQKQSFYTRDLVNSYTTIDYNSGLVTYAVPWGDILRSANNILTTQTFRGQIQWKKSLHGLESSILAGSEISSKKTEGEGFTTYGYSNENLTFTEVNNATPYKHMLTGNTSFINSGISHSLTNSRILSFFGDWSIKYNSRYLLDISARRDASNMFGLDYRDKWKPLWSTSLGWILSDEPFFQFASVNFLKLRGSYGTEGNVNPALSAVTTIQYKNNNIYTGTPSSDIDNYYNPALKWEQSAISNFGIDFSLFKNRLSGSIEYYHKKISDLYGAKPVDPTSGLRTSYLTQNVGQMKLNGWDIQLNGKIIEGQHFALNTSFIFNYNKDRITKTTRSTMPTADNMVGGLLLGVEGYPAISYFAFKWAGLNPENGAPRGYFNGQVSEDYASMRYDTSYNSIKYVGTLNPQYYGSWNWDISYKRFAVAVMFTYRLKYYFRRNSINYSNLVGNFTGHSDYALRWQKTGDEKHTDVPAFAYPVNASSSAFYASSEILATKGDNIRLQYATVEYLVLKNLLKKKNSPLQVYFSCNNAAIVWRANKYGLDPDSPNMPVSRNYSLGINLNL